MESDDSSIKVDICVFNKERLIEFLSSRNVFKDQESIDKFEEAFMEVIKKVVGDLITEVKLPEGGMYELSLIFLTEEEIRQLNHKYRGVDSPTDVISFPFIEFGIDIVPLDEVLSAEDAFPLGDIYICLSYIEKKPKYGDFLLDLVVTSIHGALHLLGYHHDTLQQEDKMWQLQDKYVNYFKEVIGSE